MNAELKSQVLWDDPLKDTAGAAAGVAKIRNRGRGPPNRYGIVPGLQWDGIGKNLGPAFSTLIAMFTFAL